MHTRTLLLLAIVALPGTANAQREQLVTRTYTQLDGLPSNIVYSIARDSMGLIWVGTSSGLAISLGKGFVVADEALILSMPPTPVLNVTYDSRNAQVLAAGTSGTACVIPFVNDKPYRIGYHVKHVMAEIPDKVLSSWDFTCILGSSRNEVVLGTKGQGVWTRNATGDDMDNFSFSRHPLRQFGHGLTVSAIVEDSSHNVWVGTTTGLYTYADSSLLAAAGPLSFLRRTAITTLNVDHEGGLWIVTADRGVYLVSADQTKLSKRGLGVAEHSVTSVSNAPNGDVWFATASSGLVRLRKGVASVFKKANGLPSNSFSCVYVDNDGLVWAGSRDGLTKILPESYFQYGEADGLPEGGFFSSMKASNGDLWFSGKGTLVRKHGTQFKYWRTPPPFARLPLIKPVEDDKGNIWTISVKGVVRFDGRRFTLFPDSLIDELFVSVSYLRYRPIAGVMLVTPKFVKRYREGTTTTFLNGQSLYDMVIDGNGNAWALGFPTVWKITPKDSVSIMRGPEYPALIATGPGDSVFVLDREVGFFSQSELEGMSVHTDQQIEEDRNNRVHGFFPEGLVTRTGHMFVMNSREIVEQRRGKRENTLTATINNLSWVSPVFERSDGSMLLASMDPIFRGIHILKASISSLLEQPLLNVTVFRQLRNGPFGLSQLGGNRLAKELQTFAEDSSETLWAATPAGILAFPRNRGNFALRAPIVSRIVVDHDVITTSDAQDESRYLFRQHRTGNTDRPDIVGFGEGERVILPPSKKNLVFFLHDVSFRREAGVYFQYRFDGVDTAWSPPSVIEEARYFDVDPGTHQFRVRAVAADGNLSTEHAILVTIIVPYWKSSWFMSLVLITLVYTAGRFYVRRIRDLREEGERSTANAIRTNEMRMAQSLQAGMLPASCPEIKGYEFAARSNPASEVGGDFYDFLNDENRLGIVLGDVSGHGITGAMIVGMARTSLRFASSRLNAPAKILSMANERLRQDISRNVFIATFYGVLEPKKRTLRYICAGLPTPILLRNGTAAHLPPTHGDRFPLGILSGVRYKEAQISLRPNDLLIFYTDGIVEAMNPAKDEFGFERLLKSVEDLGSSPITSVVDTLLNEVARFTENAPQDDDITLVALRVQKGGRS